MFNTIIKECYLLTHTYVGKREGEGERFYNMGERERESERYSTHMGERGRERERDSILKRSLLFP